MRLFDLHADTLTLCEQNCSSLLKNRYHVDAVRALSLYEQWHQILAVYVADDVEESDAWPYTYRCLQYLQNQCSALRHSEFSSKPFLLIPAIENGKAIGDDINRLVTLAEHGVFYLTVTWNGSNRLGNGCLSSRSKVWFPS